MKPFHNATSSRPLLLSRVSRSLSALALAAALMPGALSAQTLLHRYSFVSDATDSVGGANGTLQPPTTGSAAQINSGLILPGGGGCGYVSLPAGILLGTTNLTVECWVMQTATANWSEILNFGVNGTATYFTLIANNNANNNHLSADFRYNNSESGAVAGYALPLNQEQYLAVTYNANTLVGKLYNNTVLAASVTCPNSSFTPGTYGGAGGTTLNTFGVDPWNDPPFQGTIYEFRIWNGVVSQRYLSAANVAGPSVLINNLTPTSVSINVGTAVTVSGSLQADVTCQLPQTGTTNLAAFNDATNWVSSNPGVLNVSSNGVVTGVSAGTATVSATVGGVVGTSATITVSPMALIHRYSFVTDASDSVGTANGTVVAATTGTNALINNGLTLYGGGGPGYSGYVTLPSGILTNTTSVTIETWVTQNNGNGWAQIWNFYNDQSHNMGLIPLPVRHNGNFEFGISPNGGEVDCTAPIHFPTNSQQYVAVVVDSSALKGYLYDNGILMNSATYPNRTYIPGSIGGAAGTANNVLGQDPFNDPQFQGTIQEMRIWNGVVSPVYVAVSAVAGPGVIVNDTTPSSLTVSVGNTTMVGSSTQQATVTGNFSQASNVPLTTTATNWVSSNPSVLSVSSSGLITAITGGSATVSATVNGVTGTSATITVSDTQPYFTQKPSGGNLAVGDSITLNSSALGGDLLYQWSLNSVPISGATNASLVLSGVSLAQGGTYTISVHNGIGNTNATAVVSVVQAILRHRYSFVTDASDSVGTANGTVVAANGGSAAIINSGLTLAGGGGPGFSGYVTLPAGILTNTTSLTIEAWVTQNNGNGWAQIWNFGNDQSHNMGMIPLPVRHNGNFEVGISPNGGELDTTASIHFPTNTEVYTAFVVNSTNLTGLLYGDGNLLASRSFPDNTYIPGTIGGSAGTANNVLGQDPFPDPQFQGTIYEMRIWNGAVSPLYLAISAAAGPSVVVSNLTPNSITVSVTNSSMVVGQSQPATASGNFADASGVPISGYITNWSSSNPAAVTVSSSGVVTAVGAGSANINATFDGITGSVLISVPNSGPQITVNPPDSVTLLTGATLNTSIAAIGDQPIVYRWYFGSTLISTSTNPNLMVPNVQPADAGGYSCVASNQYGTAPSSTLTLTVQAPTAYQQVLQQYGPVAFWPLDETSGSIAYDLVGGHNGTYVGGYFLGNQGPTNAPFAGSGYSAGFDGTTAYVDIPGAAFNNTNAMTVVAWVQLLAYPTFGGLIGHGDTSWRMTIDGSGRAGANDGAPPSDAAAPAGTAFSSTGGWHMVAYSYNGNTNDQLNGTLYVDGQAVANNWVFTTPAGSDLDVWIAGSPDYGLNRLLPAYIADCSFYNYALTPAQVQGMFNGVYVSGNRLINITHTGSNIQLSWQSGVLLQAPTITGPWTTNSAATSPYTIPTTNSSMFFKVQ